MVLLDVRGLSSVTNFYVVATGNSSPHLKAMASDLDDQLRAAGASRFRKSGTPESGWVVSDYLDVVVHLFAREQRAYYALEQLWNDAKRVP